MEFAGTAVTSPSPFGTDIAPDKANFISQELIGINPDLQWSEGSFRGFFTLTVSEKNVTAQYFAMRDLSTLHFSDILQVSGRIPDFVLLNFLVTLNTDGFNSATFTVLSGEMIFHMSEMMKI